MPTPETGNVQITVAQLWTLVGTASTIIIALIAALWNILLERVKKCEGRLDLGINVFGETKIKIMEISTEQKNLTKTIENHEKSSDAYRAGNDTRINSIDKALSQQIAKCLEKNH